MKWFDESEKISKILSRLIDEFPICSDNWKDWVRFCEMVRSNLNTIEVMAKFLK